MKMKAVVLFLVFMLLITLACSASSALATPTPLPTYTLQPTYTPLPTFTPVPTNTTVPTPVAIPGVDKFASYDNVSLKISLVYTSNDFLFGADTYHPNEATDTFLIVIFEAKGALENTENWTDVMFIKPDNGESIIWSISTWDKEKSEVVFCFVVPKQSISSATLLLPEGTEVDLAPFLP